MIKNDVYDNLTIISFYILMKAKGKINYYLFEKFQYKIYKAYYKKLKNIN